MARRKQPKYIHVGELKINPKVYWNLRGRSRKILHIYRTNKKWFDRQGVSYEDFSEEVKDYQRRGRTHGIESAVREWSHQEDFVSKEERGLRNIMKSMGPETRKALVEQMGGKVVIGKNGRPVYLNQKGGFFSFSKDYLDRPTPNKAGWFWDDAADGYVYVDESGNFSSVALAFNEDDDEGDEGGTPIQTGIAHVVRR